MTIWLIPWYWVPITLFVGLVAGLMIGGALADGHHADDCSACQAERLHATETNI